MKIQLIDKDPRMVYAWKAFFSDVPEVDIICTSAFDVPTECIISPANSFAFLDGGFDAVITKILGPGVQTNAQKKLKEEYSGELLVGQAMLVDTCSDLVPYCILAPTMRVPMYLGPNSVNAYLAARAIFILLKNPNLPFNSVTIPGLGTGVGKIPYENCAHQMRMAYEEYFLGKWQEPSGWWNAQVEHQKLFRFKSVMPVDLQHETGNVDNVISDEEVENLHITRIPNTFPGPTKL